MNFAKTTRIAGDVRLQIRFEVFNLLNQTIYDERNYENNPTNAVFGTIDRRTVAAVELPALRSARDQADLLIWCEGPRSAARYSVLLLTPALAILAAPALLSAPRAVAVEWADLPASIQRRLASKDVTAASFPTFRTDLDRRTHERVRESDLDALIYYALQSASFTKERPIEPALSAKTYVESLDSVTRARFLKGEAEPIERIPRDARDRIAAFAVALEKPPPFSRLGYLGDIARTLSGGPKSSTPSTTVLLQEYARSMRFLFQKEFAPREGPDPAAAIATLYRTRGLSTDTAIEAGYLVHLGLATLKAADPAQTDTARPHRWTRARSGAAHRSPRGRTTGELSTLCRRRLARGPESLSARPVAGDWCRCQSARGSTSRPREQRERFTHAAVGCGR